VPYFEGLRFTPLSSEARCSISAATRKFEKLGAKAEAVVADLGTLEGVDRLYEQIGGRAVDALLANAGRGLGKGFLDQSFDDVRRVVDTNTTGTIYLIQKVGRDMRGRGSGRILITGSIAGFLPGAFQAVYNGTKAFYRFLFVRPPVRD
jgi:short-subunit dehydrogenase